MKKFCLVIFLLLFACFLWWHAQPEILVPASKIIMKNPKSPGGMQVKDLDKTIYHQLIKKKNAKAAQKIKVLPSSEQPIDIGRPQDLENIIGYERINKKAK